MSIRANRLLFTLATFLMIGPIAAYSEWITTTITTGDKVYICTTCCVGASCTTSCF